MGSFARPTLSQPLILSTRLGSLLSHNDRFKVRLVKVQSRSGARRPVSVFKQLIRGVRDDGKCLDFPRECVAHSMRRDAQSLEKFKFLAWACSKSSVLREKSANQ